MISRNRLTVYLALLTTTAIWGIAGPVIKLTLNSLPPFTFLFYRFLLSSVVCLPILLYQFRHAQITTAGLPRLFFLGLMSTTLNLSLIFLGFQRTTALDGTLLSSITPLFIVIGGAIFLKDKLTTLEKIGLATVIFGALVTVIQPLLENRLFAQQNLLGNFFILLAGLEWTGYLLLAKNDFKKYSPLVLTTSASLVGLLTFWPLAILENNLALQPAAHLTIIPLLGVAYMAIFSYFLAYFLYNFGVSKIEVSEAAIFSYLQPIFAAPFALLWLKESISLPFLIGAGIIAFGVLLSEWKPTPGQIKRVLL